MLPFHEQIIQELTEEQGLVVMAAGLGLRKVLAGLVRLYHPSSVKSGTGAGTPPAEAGITGTGKAPPTGKSGQGTTLVSSLDPGLSASAAPAEVAAPPAAEAAPLSEQATKSHPCVLILNLSDEERQALREEVAFQDPAIAGPVDITNAQASAERVSLYSRGGCLTVTSRILVVDFLIGRVDPMQVCTRIPHTNFVHSHRTKSYDCSYDCCPMVARYLLECLERLQFRL